MTVFNLMLKSISTILKMSREETTFILNRFNYQYIEFHSLLKIHARERLKKK